MSGYREDRQWSDKFIPQIKSIVGPLLLEPASFKLDAKEATDLIVFRARDMRIAARIRNHEYLKKYSHQFTIRSRRDSGAETELSKIVNGWGDWFFYGFSDREERTIVQWILIDLDHFRATLIRNSMNDVKIICGDGSNGDGTHFKWFDVRSFPASLLIASSRVEDVRRQDELRREFLRWCDA